jgi:hypothetical protein
MIPDHTQQLDKATREALRIAEQRVLWEGKPARLRCGSARIDAYPISRSGGRVAWRVTEGNDVTAYGVF